MFLFSARMAAALARQTPKAANMAKQVFKNTHNITTWSDLLTK